ncbi:hypothetical protein ONS95_013901 [Cadophora gregata]|uniref:uncharacterized protein n=1 Tax=Cadophora gregata TaxID=51156 RepID=UPI0026DD895A|nr:uncharacterized protein ONS95_013901 [Cadophora gregata]KAK0113654.1 hypothetical protein ONS96_014510 [Cadophora gregata f. sp. sojae]KAK0114409.1 hypothetical protein ONS95_013901 [Cadophora gregata]
MSKYVRHEKSQRKHPVVSSATSPNNPLVAPTAPRERPGWKGPGFVKKIRTQPKANAGQSKCEKLFPAVQQQHLPLPLQQLLLSVLRASFPVCQDYDTLKPILREIRLAMSDGDSAKAFSRPDLMVAYAVRWSSVRALCCATVFVEILQDFHAEIWIENLFEYGHDSKQSLKVTCFGGGVTEILTFAAVLRHIRPHMTIQQSHASGLAAIQNKCTPVLDLRLLDSADWAPAVSILENALLTPPVLSKYASQSAILNNTPFITSNDLRASFQQTNALELSHQELRAIVGHVPTLITLFFTLKDLHAASTARTAALLLKLSLEAPRGSLLLVIDSAEPLQKAADGLDEADKYTKKYGISNFLDLVLMEKVPNSTGGKTAWEELIRDDNRLFKLAEGLKFPIGLDHVTFQLHLFKKR